MERETAQPQEYSARSPVPFFGKARDAAPLDRYEGELAGNEEGVYQQEESDERQTGDGTNGGRPGSRFVITLMARPNVSHPRDTFS